MNIENQIKRLQLFNEKVNLINEFRFARKVAEEQVGAIAEYKKGNGWKAIYIGPDEESIHAVVNTIRMFIQDNDMLSLKKMDSFYSSLPISNGIRDKFHDARMTLNKELDSRTHWSIEENRNLTYRDILDIFIYGHYSHTNAKKQRTFKELSETPFFPLMQADFVRVLSYFIKLLNSLKEINEEAIAELTKLKG